jgi:hypothetical protein
MKHVAETSAPLETKILRNPTLSDTMGTKKFPSVTPHVSSDAMAPAVWGFTRCIFSRAIRKFPESPTKAPIKRHCPQAINQTFLLTIPLFMPVIIDGIRIVIPFGAFLPRMTHKVAITSMSALTATNAVFQPGKSGPVNNPKAAPIFKPERMIPLAIPAW